MAQNDTILHQEDVVSVIDAEISEKTLRTGVVTLLSGTATVLDTHITVNSIIVLYCKTVGGTPGALFISAKTEDTSFVISSTSITDGSVVRYDVIYDTPDKVAVPNLIGLSDIAVAASLIAVGLKLGVMTMNEPGMVDSQSIAAGIIVNRGTSIDVHIG